MRVQLVQSNAFPNWLWWICFNLPKDKNKKLYSVFLVLVGLLTGRNFDIDAKSTRSPMLQKCSLQLNLGFKQQKISSDLHQQTWCYFLVLKQDPTVIFVQLNTHHHEGGVVFNLLVSHLWSDPPLPRECCLEKNHQEDPCWVFWLHVALCSNSWTSIVEDNGLSIWQGCRVDWLETWKQWH